MLRDEIIEHYRDRGEKLDTPAGRRTLDTNTTLAGAARSAAAAAAGRARRTDGPARAERRRPGLRLRRAEPVPRHRRRRGRRHRSQGRAPRRRRARCRAPASAGDVPRGAGWRISSLDDEQFDIAVLNNSLCYIVPRGERMRALRHTLRVLVPGGWLVMRNPARMAPLDPFTGLPLVHQLPPALAARLLRRRTPPRSAVRLRTGGARVA